MTYDDLTKTRLYKSPDNSFWSLTSWSVETTDSAQKINVELTELVPIESGFRRATIIKGDLLSPIFGIFTAVFQPVALREIAPTAMSLAK